MSMVSRPSLWPDITGPSGREGWWRGAIEAADRLINHTPRQRGAGLGSDTRHDRPVLWLVAPTVAWRLPLTREPLPAYERLRRTPPVDTADSVNTGCASCFISDTSRCCRGLLTLPRSCLVLLFLSVRPFVCLPPAQFNEECCTMTCYLYRKCV